MKNIRAITFIALLVSNQFAFSQTETDTIAIQNELNAIFERDQYIRKSDDSAQFRTMIDSSNLSKVEALITKYGWPGKSFVGAKEIIPCGLSSSMLNLKLRKNIYPCLKSQ